MTTTNVPQASPPATPKTALPVGTQFPPSAIRSPMPTADLPVGDQNSPGGHGASGAHPRTASGATTPPPSHTVTAAHPRPAGRGPILADRFLGLLAASVDDLEGTRKSLANRYRQLTRTESDSDGYKRGFGLTDAAPEVAMLRTILAAIGGEKLDGSGGVEHRAILDMGRQMRKHPLWKSWAARQRGIGEKQLARLLASIGDPYWNELHNRPRTVSELWAYCGLHVVHPADQPRHGAHGVDVGGVAPKRARGQKANWSDDARMRVWNIAGSCLKAQDAYADVYYAAREKYAESTHSDACVRCGPKNKPAPVRSPLNDGHKHARALRIVSKEILKDLWLAARKLHGDEPETPPIGQKTAGAHLRCADGGLHTPAADHCRSAAHASAVGGGFNIHTNDSDGTAVAILLQDWAALSPELIS